MPRITASEPVLRHRGAVRDENGQFGTEESPATIMAFAVAPGGGSDRADRSRSGEEISCTVYFPTGTDVQNGDELTVRGQRFRIIVNKWASSHTEVGGVEVLCVRGSG